jgi:divalent metal cation (Fe/Co/Zn/Cd) transporter
MPPKSRSLVAAFGAFIYGLFGVRILWSSLPSLVVSLRDALSVDGGGMFGFSMEIIVVPYVLLALASIVASVMLRSWARGSGGAVRALHRTHRWSIVLAFVVAVASVVGVNIAGSPLPIVLMPLSAITWGLQFVLTAVLLGTYAFRTSRA